MRAGPGSGEAPCALTLRLEWKQYRDSFLNFTLFRKTDLTPSGKQLPLGLSNPQMTRIAVER